jgi:UDP-N-acetylmuramoyl-tripeptide--D-alanyl-D-alanine ligase
MVAFRLDEIAAKLAGRIVQGDPNRAFDKFGIDSRLSEPGGLFFAIVARRNGHDFIPDAARKGAAGAVISQDVIPPKDDFALLRVGDTMAALQELGRAALASCPVKVVGITGSIGKTTTKEFAASLISGRYRVLKSEGNLNNRLGLALSVLRLQPVHQVAVLEMAMSAAGEIRALTRIAPPDIAVITNVNPVHQEFFPDLDSIALAKKEILEGLKKEGTAVLNGDDPLVEKISRGWKGRRISFGFSPGSDIQASGIQKLGENGLAFELRVGVNREKVRFGFLYEEYLYNLLAAVGAGRALDVPFADLCREIPRLRPLPGRGMLFRLNRGIRVIDDSYNSNPKALASALKGLSGLPAKRRIAVIGDMLELGKNEAAFHRAAGEQAAESGWDVLVTVGLLGSHTAAGARGAGIPASRIFSFSDSSSAAEKVPGLLQEGDLVLVKGSRGVRTEQVVEKLKEAFKEN